MTSDAKILELLAEKVLQKSEHGKIFPMFAGGGGRSSQIFCILQLKQFYARIKVDLLGGISN